MPTVEPVSVVFQPILTKEPIAQVEAVEQISRELMKNHGKQFLGREPFGDYDSHASSESELPEMTGVTINE